LIGPTEFDGLQHDWNRLLSRSQWDNVFLRWEWIHTWWAHFHQDRKLFIWTVHQDERLVAILPLYIDQPSPFGFRYLRICSDDLSPDYLDVIQERDLAPEIFDALLKSLHEYSSRWDIVSLEHLRIGSTLLNSKFPDAHYGVSADRSHTCPYVKIQGEYGDYFENQLRQGLHRYHIDKKKKKLFGQKDVRHLRAHTDAERGEFLDYLFQLHEQRADSIQRHSFFARPDVKRFHHEVSRLFLEAGFLNLQVLVQGRLPVGAAYGFDYHNKMYFFQSGFDPAWSSWSPGFIMISLMIEESFKNGFEEFDFLKGEESYKSLWANAVREQQQMIAYNRTLLGTTAYTAALSKNVLRNVKATMSLSTHRMIRGFS
jgi:CelD/BcsL family acetyltransferase involved in cellulose biosynthesis